MTLSELLAGLTREQLIALLMRLVDRQPDLIETIRLVHPVHPDQAAEAPTPDVPPPLPQHPPIDLADFRLRVGATFGGAGRRSHRGGYAQGGVGDVWALLAEITPVVVAGDSRSALPMLEELITGYLNVVEWLEEFGDEGGDGFFDAGRLATEAVLGADLTMAERAGWGEKLEAWQGQLAEYSLEDTLTPAIAAAEQGWDHPPLQRILRGETGLQDEAAPEQSEELVVARLNVLERQGRYEEFLRLAAVTRQAKRSAMMLARLGRAEEAVAYARQHVTIPLESLGVAQALHERGSLECALTVAELGLGLEGSKAELAKWLRDLATGLGRSDLALTAALVAFREQRSLTDYLQVQGLAGAAWPELRAELLDLLRSATSYYPSGQVDVFLHEGLLDDAIAAVDKGATHELVERVVDAALATRPDWAIQASRRQAEGIMNAAKAQYYVAAADWLKRMRTAYQATGREADWQAYLQTLLEQHRRKRNLMPLLTTLR
jgi:uncharacterized Zn finger protein